MQMGWTAFGQTALILMHVTWKCVCVCVCPFRVRESADAPSRFEAVNELLHGASDAIY